MVTITQAQKQKIGEELKRVREIHKKAKKKLIKEILAKTPSGTRMSYVFTMPRKVIKRKPKLYPAKEYMLDEPSTYWGYPSSESEKGYWW